MPALLLLQLGRPGFGLYGMRWAQSSEFMDTADILYPLLTIVGANKKLKSDGYRVAARSVLHAHHILTNQSDPDLVARLNRSNLFTRDAASFLYRQAPPVGSLVRNTTTLADGSRGEVYGMVFEILGYAQPFLEAGAVGGMRAPNESLCGLRVKAKTPTGLPE